MNWFKEFVQHFIKGAARAILRFPFTVLCLISAAVLICYMISLHNEPSLIIQKSMFTLLVGAILGVTAQFAAERFKEFAKIRPLVYLASVIFTAGYFAILWSAPEISQEIAVRTFVAIFAMVCAVLWLPSYKEKADFNKVGLIHFKSVFTSVLYSGVLSAGLAAIIAAIDSLLFQVNNDSYAYMMTIVWVLFATIYYLSLLPKFNCDEQCEIEVVDTAAYYPKFLEILISYIAIPLITVYTLVLFAYFIKIFVTLNWPSGQLGPMVLIYSAVGLIVFVLASLLENIFAKLYLRIFPIVIIPIVIMQLISVGIRLNAYGVTESRYYVVLFGIFSIVIGILLNMKRSSKNSYIALLAAVFAVFSVIPPLDAFTVSRNSQINRVEGILQSEGLLVDGKLKAKADVSEKGKTEITNILSYLDMHSSLKYIDWLPKDFAIYNMKKYLGFEPTYPNYGDNNRYFNANLDQQQPMQISGYDISASVFSSRFDKQESPSSKFTANGLDYELFVKRSSNQEVRISVRDTAGTEVIGTGLYEFTKKLAETETGATAKGMMAPEKLTFQVSQNGYKLKIILQNINITYGTGTDAGVDYTAYVLFGAPERN